MSTLEACSGLISFSMGAIFQIEVLLVVAAIGLVAIGLADLFYWMIPWLQQNVVFQHFCGCPLSLRGV